MICSCPQRNKRAVSCFSFKKLNYFQMCPRNQFLTAGLL